MTGLSVGGVGCWRRWRVAQRVASARKRHAARRRAPGVVEVVKVVPVLLTVRQAAAMLGVSRTTLYPLVMSGKIGSLTIGSCRRIPVAEVERFVEMAAGA